MDIPYPFSSPMPQDQALIDEFCKTSAEKLYAYSPIQGFNVDLPSAAASNPRILEDMEQELMPDEMMKLKKVVQARLEVMSHFTHLADRLRRSSHSEMLSRKGVIGPPPTHPFIHPREKEPVDKPLISWPKGTSTKEGWKISDLWKKR